VPELGDLELSIRLAGIEIAGAEAVPAGVGLEVASTGSVHTLHLREVPLYTIVFLRDGGV